MSLVQPSGKKSYPEFQESKNSGKHQIYSSLSLFKIICRIEFILNRLFIRFDGLKTLISWKIMYIHFMIIWCKLKGFLDHLMCSRFISFREGSKVMEDFSSFMQAMHIEENRRLAYCSTVLVIINIKSFYLPMSSQTVHVDRLSIEDTGRPS